MHRGSEAPVKETFVGSPMPPDFLPVCFANVAVPVTVGGAVAAVAVGGGGGNLFFVDGARASAKPSGLLWTCASFAPSPRASPGPPPGKIGKGRCTRPLGTLSSWKIIVVAGYDMVVMEHMVVIWLYYGCNMFVTWL